MNSDTTTTAPAVKPSRWDGQIPCPEIPNGVFTLVNGAASSRRTVKIARQPNLDVCPYTGKKVFMPGARLVSVLTGPDNDNDYTSVGMLCSDGSVRIWRSQEGGSLAAVATFAVRVLRRQAQGLGNPVEIIAASRCARCNKTLTVPSSIAVGMGPECASK